MFFDGKISLMKKSFTQPDKYTHVHKIGYAHKNHFKAFAGEISQVNHYNSCLSDAAAVKLTLNQKIKTAALFSQKKTSALANTARTYFTQRPHTPKKWLF